MYMKISTHIHNALIHMWCMSSLGDCVERNTYVAHHKYTCVPIFYMRYYMPIISVEMYSFCFIDVLILGAKSLQISSNSFSTMNVYNIVFSHFFHFLQFGVNYIFTLPKCIKEPLTHNYTHVIIIVPNYISLFYYIFLYIYIYIAVYMLESPNKMTNKMYVVNSDGKLPFIQFTMVRLIETIK